MFQSWYILREHNAYLAIDLDANISHFYQQIEQTKLTYVQIRDNIWLELLHRLEK